MDIKALYKLSYGLYLLTAKENDFHNGCIINTVMQVAEEPVRVAVSVLKKNLTHDMILNTGEFNVSAITNDADFELFKRFGMASGRDGDKFHEFFYAVPAANGICFLTTANMYLSAKVISHTDLGTHTLFIAEVTECKSLSDDKSCTYEYYQTNIKPAPVKTAKEKWVCNVCGYVYEGDELPDDYVCPLCRHGKEDFTYIPGEPEKTEEVKVKKYVCPVCGYVHEGDAPPEVCPWCKIPGKDFREE